MFGVMLLCMLEGVGLWRRRRRRVLVFCFVFIIIIRIIMRFPQKGFRIILSSVHSVFLPLRFASASRSPSPAPPTREHASLCLSLSSSAAVAAAEDEEFDPLVAFTCASLLRSCGELQMVCRVHAVVSRISVAAAAPPPIHLSNTLIHMYGCCRDVEAARSTFDTIPRRNVYSWNILAAVYAANGDSAQSLCVFHKMLLPGGTRPDSVSYASALRVCTRLRSLHKGKPVHAHISSSSTRFETDTAIGTALALLYGACGRLQSARTVFDQTITKDSAAWNALISIYAQNGHIRDALVLLQAMKCGGGGAKPNCVTYTSLLAGCTAPSALFKGKLVHASFADSGAEADIPLCNSLLSMYGTCGRVEVARRVFDRMPQRDVVSWTGMITSYSRRNDSEEEGVESEAMELFWSMHESGVRPNAVTFISVLSACASPAEGKVVHADTVAHGCVATDTVVANAILTMYGKCGRLEEARNMFAHMRARDVFSWTGMIDAYGQNGHGKAAVALFWEMMQHSSSALPNRVTFASALHACSHAGLVREGRLIFTAMVESLIVTTPGTDHIGCMVDLLGRAGLLDEAEDMIRALPFEPYSVAASVQWVMLLAACTTHGDVERGVLAAMHAFEFDPTNPSPFVLLSNLYAAAGMWHDVANIRKSLQDRNIKKQPGCSWIQVKGKMHKFLVGDGSHPQHKEISELLAKLGRRIKEAGYTPDTTVVLHDVSEEEKEEILCSHSERLAIGFGLLSTPHGMPLYITKNLRICSDCHTAAKFISKIVQRRIVLRDHSRFHHIEHGFCSCKDFF